MIAVQSQLLHAIVIATAFSKRDLKEDKELVLSEFIIISWLLRCLCEVSRWDKLLNHYVKGTKVLKKTLHLSDGC